MKRPDCVDDPENLVILFYVTPLGDHNSEVLSALAG